jgi:DNA-binding CsgD family transcriptional regulator
MDLLERDAALSELGSGMRAALGGEGRLALVGGEAGIGKTTLVEHLAATRPQGLRVVWGACDALFTPRPLGPLRDIAEQVPGELETLLTTGADRTAIFNAVLALLQARPVLAIVEDVHWADEATLDLLRFVGRRIGRTSALLVLTYRDDEIGPRHPLRPLLGDLAASSAAIRVHVPPFSEQALRALVGPRPLDVATLHRQTGGNPFFVTEVLAHPAERLPATVRDAVLGRLARLSASAQNVAAAAAVFGSRIDVRSLVAMLPDDAPAADECVAGGVLVAHPDGMAFRHELARQAVLGAVALPRRIELHALALDVMRQQWRLDTGGHLATLAHHADGAANRGAILQYAPAAAREAASVGSHRAAAALLRRALECADDLPGADRAELLEAYSRECYLIAELDESIVHRQQAVQLWHALGNRLKEGENLGLLAVALSGADRRDEARETVDAAIALLEKLPGGRELALALRTRALFHTYEHELTEAIALAERAVTLAASAGDRAILASAYDTLGLASMFVDYAGGRQHVLHARQIASDCGFDAEVARTYSELGANGVQLLQLDDAERDLAEGLAYTAERDLNYYGQFMLASLAATRLFRGRWDEAIALASDVLEAQAVSTNARLMALLALGRARARQGDDRATPPLDAALELALRLRVYHAVAPTRAARAEACWLRGDPSGAQVEADAVYDRAIERRHAGAAGELAYWRALSGATNAPPDWIAAPFAQQLAGDWQAAAESWRRLGCPYEQARALAEGDAEAQQGALALFDRLGARPAAAALRHTMRTSGMTRLTRGPRTTTRANQFGLTSRQLEILGLLAQGLTNAEIGQRLSITPRTAEHHVGAVLAKLEVKSRRAAIRVAQDQQLLARGVPWHTPCFSSRV